MDGNEFAEWQAYYSIEPFGEEREDLRAAMVPFMLAQLFKRKGRKVKYETFMVSEMLKDEVKEPMSLEQMQQTLKGIWKRQEAWKGKKVG